MHLSAGEADPGGRLLLVCRRSVALHRIVKVGAYFTGLRAGIRGPARGACWSGRLLGDALPNFDDTQSTATPPPSFISSLSSFSFSDSLSRFAQL